MGNCIKKNENEYKEEIEYKDERLKTEDIQKIIENIVNY